MHPRGLTTGITEANLHNCWDLATRLFIARLNSSHITKNNARNGGKSSVESCAEPNPLNKPKMGTTGIVWLNLQLCDTLLQYYSRLDPEQKLHSKLAHDEALVQEDRCIYPQLQFPHDRTHQLTRGLRLTLVRSTLLPNSPMLSSSAKGAYLLPKKHGVFCALGLRLQQQPTSHSFRRCR